VGKDSCDYYSPRRPLFKTSSLRLLAL